MEKALVVKKEQAVSSPQQMIQLAISSGADLEKLEKLLTLQERWESNEARKAYHAAMAKFKANPPKIDKDKTVSFKTDRGGQTTYNHATLGNVTEKISAELSKYGLSASWTTKQNGAVSVTCHITHKLGHSEETTLTAKEDTSGSKNAIQALGSTITYLERYTLLALTGLATYEQDDDGIAAGKPDVKMPEAKMPETAPSVGKAESRVSGPGSEKKTQPEEDPQSKQGTDNSAGPISAEEGLDLMKTACKNGWSPKDVKEYIHGLGYDNIKKLTKWDLPTVSKFFDETRSNYDKRLKDAGK
mgnify:CR=1 FL=1